MSDEKSGRRTDVSSGEGDVSYDENCPYFGGRQEGDDQKGKKNEARTTEGDIASDNVLVTHINVKKETKKKN